MEHSVQRLQFLDLTDASENDQSLIERVLFSSNQTLEVPWFTGRADDQSEQEWIPPQYNNIDGRHEIQENQISGRQSDVDGVENDENVHEEQQQDGQSGRDHHHHHTRDHHTQDRHNHDQQPPRQGGIFTGHPPTSLPHQQMYQMVPSLSNVYVSNVTANVNVHAPYVSPIPTHYGPQMPPPQQPPPQQVYTHASPEGDQGSRVRRPRQQKDKKRDGPFIQTNEVMSPSLENHPPPQFPNIHPLPPYYIQGTAAGPLYMPPTVLPVYPPMFGPYSPSPGLVYPQANNIQPGAEEYHDNVQPNFHPPGPEVVVVGNVIRRESNGDRRGGPDGTEVNGYREVEDQVPENFQSEQRLSDPTSGGYKAPAGTSNESFEVGAEQITQQNGGGGHFTGDDDKFDPNVIETVIIKNNYYEQKQQQSATEGEKVVAKAELNRVPMAPKVEQTSQQRQPNGQFAYVNTGLPVQEQTYCSQTEAVKFGRKKVNEIMGEVVANNDVNSVDKVCVNSHSSSTAGRITGEETVGGHCSDNINNSNVSKVVLPVNETLSKSKSNTSSSVQVVINVQQENAVPITPKNEFPPIGQNTVPANRSDESSSEPLEVKNAVSAAPQPAIQVTQRGPPSGGRSWASLFDSSDHFNVGPSTADNRVRPMARVPPFHDVEGGVPQSPGSPGSAAVANPTSASHVPLLNKAERVSSPKSNGALSKKPVPNSNTNDPYLHFLGEFLCNYELDHKIVSLQPRGLTNRSNWCYINAIMQSLIVCPAFYNLLKALPVKMKRRGSNQTLIIDALVDFANEFNLVPTNARIGKREKSARNKEDSNCVEIATGPAFEPSGIYKVLHKIRGEGSFNVEGRQEDAEEFLSCLLNGLNDEMFELMKMVDSNKTVVANGDSNGAHEDDDQEWNVMGPKNKSSVTRRAVCGKTPISDIFRGQVRSRVQRAGDQSTDTVQPFFTLQLDVEKANSVKDALELLVGRDPLEGVTCSRTHQEVEAWTQMSLEDLPLVLILHLKCFDYKSDGCSKIIKSVDFSIDLKVDAKLLSNRNKYLPKQRSYKLVAVVYHDGKEASKGHYVTDAYHVGYGCWVRYDDGVVRSVPESHVLKPRLPRVPYLLYYRRTDTIGTAK